MPLPSNGKNLSELTETTSDGYVAGHVSGIAKLWDTRPWSRGRYTTITALTGTSENLSNSHEGRFLTLNNASAITLTIPNDSTLTTWPVGGRVRLMRLGAGQITVAAGSGVTLRCAGSRDNFNGQYAVCELIKIAANTWVFTGDTAAA